MYCIPVEEGCLPEGFIVAIPTDMNWYSPVVVSWNNKIYLCYGLIITIPER